MSPELRTPVIIFAHGDDRQLNVPKYRPFSSGKFDFVLIECVFAALVNNYLCDTSFLTRI